MYSSVCLNIAHSQRRCTISGTLHIKKSMVGETGEHCTQEEEPKIAKKKQKKIWSQPFYCHSGLCVCDVPKSSSSLIVLINYRQLFSIIKIIELITRMLRLVCNFYVLYANFISSNLLTYWAACKRLGESFLFRQICQQQKKTHEYRTK